MWNAVVRDTYIHAAPENKQYSEQWRQNNDIVLRQWTKFCRGYYFSSAVEYLLPHCQNRRAPFPEIVPEEADKHWLIERRGYRIVIHCNGKLVLNITVSTDTCDLPDYANTGDTVWRRRVSSEFNSYWDTASDMFYIG